MLFGTNNLKLICCRKTSLQVRHDSNNPNKGDKLFIIHQTIKPNFQKAFSSSPSFFKASMCLETALSFSFFLIFFANIFSIIALFMTYTGELSKLQQRGKELAAYAYTINDVYSENEIVLQNVENVPSLISLLPVPNAVLLAKCVVKPWTGYDVTGTTARTKEESMVYLTEYGEVYHRNRGCTHIALSIQAIAEPAGHKNIQNESYRACEYCGKTGFGTLYFITNQGTKYHTTLNCRGLKRTVQVVPLSETEGKRACTKCG